MKEPSVRPTYRPLGWTVYFALLILRFILVLLVQPGYLHPDEFFQGVEIGAGDVYGLDVFRSWEFQNSDKGPLRSIAGLCPLIHFPLWVSKSLLPSVFESTTTSYLDLNHGDLITRVLFPVRFQTVLFSMTVDLFILIACAYVRRPNSRGRRCFFSTAPPMALLLYASTAFGGLLLAGRTLANTWEMASVALFSLLALIVIRDLKTSDNRLLAITAVLCTQAILSVWATFLRTTYLLFIFPLALCEICVLLYRYKHHTLFPGSLAILFAAITIQVCLHVDTVYFTGSDPFVWQSPVNLLCIPCRFARYNSRTEHLSEHGLHPPYLHLFVNIPLIFGPVVGFLALWPPCTVRSSQTLLWICVALPLAFLSCVPHQEARFLLPLVPFILTLAGKRLEQFADRISNQKRYQLLLLVLFISWCLQQFCLTLLFGWFHQAGVISYLKSVPIPRSDSMDCPVHIFYHTYMPPRFPLGRLINTTTPFGTCHGLVDLSGSPRDRLEETVTRVYLQATRDTKKQWVMHVIYPGSLAPLNVAFEKWGKTLTSTVTHFGHLSFEDPPSVGIIFKQISLSFSGLIRLFNDLRAQLSIHVTTIQLR
ncbi:Mannosyltransferase [Fasciola hepatica]|uniref:Mannosyltransferase n=1 Tax=Fasciola hepatica TaxID=6192 RepID=A0A2H1CV95_FASHE|nr:Mannosyltransferase [Fasciola hepatica]